MTRQVVFFVVFFIHSFRSSQLNYFWVKIVLIPFSSECYIYACQGCHDPKGPLLETGGKYLQPATHSMSCIALGGLICFIYLLQGPEEHFLLWIRHSKP